MNDCWEYTCPKLIIAALDKEGWQANVADLLNSYGEEGWELVYISETFIEAEDYEGYALFKRRKNGK